MDAPSAPDLGATFLSLYDEALPAVYGYLRRRVPSESVAQDLTSETFLAAVTSIKTGVTVHVSVAWLMGIARHKLLDHFRRVERDERNLRAVAADAVVHDDPWTETLRQDVTSETLAELGLHHRSALTLRHLDGLYFRRCASPLALRCGEKSLALRSRGPDSPFPKLPKSLVARCTPPRPFWLALGLRFGRRTRSSCRGSEMTDAFDALRLSDHPLVPPSRFAKQLRTRLERAFGVTPAIPISSA